MRTVIDIVEDFGGTAEFAQIIGTTSQNVTNMKARNSIPSRFWRRLVACAASRRMKDVTLDVLADMHAYPRERRSA
jgi:hypothetical protein